MSQVTVGELMETLGGGGDFVVVAGGQRGLERLIGQRSVQRVGVALTGFIEHLVPDRVQAIGRSESGYLDALDPEERHTQLDRVFSVGFPVLVLTTGITPWPELIDLAESHGCALVATPLESTIATEQVNAALAGFLAPKEVRHAVLLDVHGVGVLLTGKSGIGKSEVGLELVARGHRLVSDDLVVLQQMNRRVVVGSCPDLTRHHMEIRGIGIINIKELFGASAVREHKKVEMVVELVEWDDRGDYERLGLTTDQTEIVGVGVDYIVLPVRSGRSLSLIIEVAARNRLLKAQGTHSAQAFAERLRQRIARADSPLTETRIDHGEGDNE